MTVATYPAYDGTSDASAWQYGLAHTLASGGVFAGHTGTTAGTWGIDTMPLDLAAGTYYLTEVGIVCGFTAEVDCTTARFAIFEDDAGELTPITLGNGATYVDISDGINHTTFKIQQVIASVSFTLEAGKSYQMAWGLLKAGTTTGRPGVYRMNNGQGPQGLTCYTNVAEAAEFPAAYTGTANSSGEIPRGYIKFTTAERILVSTSYATAKDMVIPKRTDSADWVIKLRNAVVEDGEALSLACDADNAGDDIVRTTWALDMGAADQVTFGAANVALAAAGAEAGDTIDMLVEWRGDGKADCFYLNKTTGQGPLGAKDFATLSHALLNDAAGDGSRGQEYTISSPAYLKLTGTAAVATIQVGWQPIVMFGDSQCTKTLEGEISSTNRLGHYVPLAFEHPRIFWPAWIAGSCLTQANGVAQSAAYLRYKSVTAGQGDLCEMTSVVFCIGGIGINDISTNVGTTEANRNKIVALMATRMAEILDDLQDRAIPTLVIGLPPYSDGNASEQEAQCVKQWNVCLEGLACGVRAAYCNPWHAMGGTSAAIPTFTTGYSDDAGLHYNTAGAAVVAAGAARALETGIVGGWWSNPVRRLARELGRLFPL